MPIRADLGFLCHEKICAQPKNRRALKIFRKIYFKLTLKFETGGFFKVQPVEKKYKKKSTTILQLY